LARPWPLPEVLSLVLRPEEAVGKLAVGKQQQQYETKAQGGETHDCSNPLTTKGEDTTCLARWQGRISRGAAPASRPSCRPVSCKAKRQAGNSFFLHCVFTIPSPFLLLFSLFLPFSPPVLPFFSPVFQPPCSAGCRVPGGIVHQAPAPTPPEQALRPRDARNTSPL